MIDSSVITGAEARPAVTIDVGSTTVAGLKTSLPATYLGAGVPPLPIVVLSPLATVYRYALQAYAALSKRGASGPAAPGPATVPGRLLQAAGQRSDGRDRAPARHHGTAGFPGHR